eukprot:12998889-Alexandrium_andersonii.AAC.1
MAQKKCSTSNRFLTSTNACHDRPSFPQAFAASDVRTSTKHLVARRNSCRGLGKRALTASNKHAAEVDANTA